MASTNQGASADDSQAMQMWSYKGVDIFPADRNSSGIRWYARTKEGVLRSDTKQGMKQLINRSIK